MRQEWEPEDLVASWTLVEQDERELVAYKRGATQLGFALMLKFPRCAPAPGCGCARPTPPTTGG